jgi:hypothetical protein
MTARLHTSTDTTVAPEDLDQWLPDDLQRHCVSILSQRVGFTRRRAECFVRLVTYLWLKERADRGKPPQAVQELTAPEGFVPCTHREACELFYAGGERGTERAAGMMLDELAKLRVIEKQFDGNTICIQVHSLAQLFEVAKPEAPVELCADTFNPKTDAVLVSRILATNYNWMSATTKAVPAKIARLLRQWSRDYPQGIRVLRRPDNQQPVGCYILFPVAPASEETFYLPPCRGLHLSTNAAEDPFQMAKVGDAECTSVLVRSVMIDRPYMQPHNLCLLLQDAQENLVRMRQDFPGLCDLYALTIHPMYEELSRVTGFQKIDTDPHLAIHWMYQALDYYLELDVPKAVAELKL